MAGRKGTLVKRSEIKGLIEEYANWWTKWLGLRYWNIKFETAKNPDEDGLAGTSAVDWRYQEATITFYLKTMKHMQPDEIEKIVVHELMHIFLNEMREEGIDHEERVATMLQKAFMWVKEVEK